MPAERRPRNKPVRLTGDKKTFVVKARCGTNIKLHYRRFRKGGKVYRVLTGPFLVD